MTTQKPNKNKIYTYLIVGLCLALLLLLAIVFYWLKPKADQTTATKNTNTINTTQTSSQQTTLPASSPAPVTAQNQTENLPPLPHSLQGTQVDGEIIIDENKNLVVTKGLRRLFDYFLSAQGEESLDIIHKRVADYIRQHTPEPASTQAITIYFQYIKYLSGLANIEKQYTMPSPDQANATQKLDLNKISQRQSAVNGLQKSLFDDKTIKAFFGEENALNAYTMAGIQVSKDPSLTDEQKAQAIELAKQQYMASFDNPELKAQLQQQDNVAKLLEETQKLKAQGASQDQLNAMRRKYVDEKAVQRLENLDKEEQAFDNKFTAYQQQRDSILAAQGNTPTAQKAVESLQKQSFNEQEIKRLEGYEAVKKSLEK